jgi:hypothetical protein
MNMVEEFDRTYTQPHALQDIQFEVYKKTHTDKTELFIAHWPGDVKAKAER